MSEILIIGVSTVDLIGGPLDEYPEPGGLRTFEQLTLAPGGCAVNVALGLARLGLKCDLITRIGADPLGAYLKEELQRHRISDRGLIVDQTAPTPFSFVVVHRDGQRSFLHCPGANSRLNREDVPREQLIGRRFVMLSGAMIMERLDGEPCASLLRAARRQGAVTLLDTVFVEGFDTAAWQARLLPCLEQIDYFAPSLPEARALTGLDEPGRVVDRLLEFGARNVVLKLDAEGALLATKGGRRAHLPAYPVEQVVDSTGAGDSFCAGFLAGLATGRPPFEAARLGNAVAHHCIQARGATAGVPTLALADAFLERGASGTVPTDVT